VRFCALLVSACVLAPWRATAQVSSGPSTAATGPRPADRLAAASLDHSARSLGHLREGSIAARAGRIRALLEAARRISPDDAETNRQMLDLYEGLGDAEQAAQAADRYLRVRPDDYAVFLRWLRLAQAGLDRADDRIAFLETVAADRRLSPGARAAALGEVAGIRLCQGEDSLARQACAGALDLDALEAGALAVRAQLATQPAPRDVPRAPAPADTFALALAMFRRRGEPRQGQTALFER
jgi:hypothetical protein